MDIPFEGRCACGAVSFACHAHALAMYNCHCHGCQKISGAPYTVLLIMRAEHVSIEGKGRKFKSLVKGDPHCMRTYCPECHAMLFAASEEKPDILLFNALALDDSSGFLPVADIWTAHVQAWTHLDRRIPKVLKSPPLLGENFV